MKKQALSLGDKDFNSVIIIFRKLKEGLVKWGGSEEHLLYNHEDQIQPPNMSPGILHIVNKLQGRENRCISELCRNLAVL